MTLSLSARLASAKTMVLKGVLRLLPGGSEFTGWGFHPLESAAFARRTPEADEARLEIA